MTRVKRLLAVQNSFPNLSRSAEIEFIKRLEICCERQNVDFMSLITSDEILQSRPPFLVALHEFSPKLTPIATIGAMWNPPSGIRGDPVRINNLRSYDGYMSASRSVTEFVRDETQGFELEKSVAHFRFFPSAPARIAEARSFQSLVYVGVHWDGFRHNELLGSLAKEGLITFYGPQDKWLHHGSSYRSEIPFDGSSVLHRLADHGVVLCLHRDAHVEDDTPSMRLFEAASAGCLIISDDIPFARTTFGDTIFILPKANRSEFIAETLAIAQSHPNRVREMARESREIFEKFLSLDVLLPKILKFGEATSKKISQRTGQRFPFRFLTEIEVLVFVNSIDQTKLIRALDSLDRQHHRSVSLVIVRSPCCAELDDKITRRRPGLRVRIIELQTSDFFSSLSAVIDQVATPFFSVLDEDCTWAASHLSSLFSALESDKSSLAARAGCVRVASDGRYVDAPNFGGDLDVPIAEMRKLSDLCNPDSIGEINEMAGREPNNWLARTRMLRTRLAEFGASSDKSSDEIINVVRKSSVATGSPTLYWHQ